MRFRTRILLYLGSLFVTVALLAAFVTGKYGSDVIRSADAKNTLLRSSAIFRVLANYLRNNSWGNVYVALENETLRNPDLLWFLATDDKEVIKVCSLPEFEGMGKSTALPKISRAFLLQSGDLPGYTLRAGEVIYEMGRSELERDIMQKDLLAGKRGEQTVETRWTLLDIQGKRRTVCLGFSLRDTERRIATLWELNIGIAFLLLTGMLGILALMSHSIVRPLHTIIADLETLRDAPDADAFIFRIRKMEIVSPPDAPLEIVELDEAFMQIRKILIDSWDTLRTRDEEIRTANERLARHAQELEETVAERTSELAARNERLECEIAERKRVETELRHLSVTDALTGLANRRAIHEELDRFTASGDDYALIIADIDHFKEINDRFGHMAGDAALVALARTMHEVFRPADLLGRYGGEEFLAVLPHASPDETLRLAERFRSRIHGLRIHWQEDDLSMTISVGISRRFDDDHDADAVVHRADQALYLAKERGRNRVESLA